MKTPKKSELYRKIDDLEAAHAKLQSEKEQEVYQKIIESEAGIKKEWADLIPSAYEAFRKFADNTYPNLVIKENLEHIDAAGYWFSFELENDSRRQTYAVRHSDLI